MSRYTNFVASLAVAIVSLSAMVPPVLAKPVISSFDPTMGSVGDTVTITGSGFLGVYDVSFNGLGAYFYLESDTVIYADVPAGAATGPITITSDTGTYSSDGDFTVYTPIHPPIINSFTPTRGKAGDAVTIRGVNFTGLVSVEFNGQAASYAGDYDDSQITAYVPEGATSGYISVTAAGGSASSVEAFTVYTSLPVIIDPGEGYRSDWRSISLNYRLEGSKTYIGILTPNYRGYSLIDDIEPGKYQLSLAGSHWLKRIVPGINVDGYNFVHTSLTNGDADGNNMVNLFDFVVLDSHFGTIDLMADLDGNGAVNLFDYVIVDNNLGALGDEMIAPVTNPIDGAEMVWVCAGLFDRGSASMTANEMPQRSIYLDGYWIYKYEVTVAQYRKFCEAKGRSMPSAPSWGWKDSHPMVNVTWQNAVDYANWAGAELPTEAQWEKAARGTDGRDFPWGNVWDASRCHNYTNSAGTTKPVGSYPSGASPYGVMDMAGSVWEYCSDWYVSNYYRTSPGSNPLGPTSGTERVVRGGSWLDDGGGPVNYYRCAFRMHGSPASEGYNGGFRCVKR